MITIIAAVDIDYNIGKNGKLPWPKSTKDMEHFRKTTTGHCVIMGRKTFESIGKPLPRRENIVISSTLSQPSDNSFFVSPDIHCALDHCDNVHPGKEIYIIGGGLVYNDAMHLADNIILTRFVDSFDGDVKFPRIDPGEWVLTSTELAHRTSASECPMMIYKYSNLRLPSSQDEN